jgi:hypothetical protein
MAHIRQSAVDGTYKTVQRLGARYRTLVISRRTREGKTLLHKTVMSDKTVTSEYGTQKTVNALTFE